MSAWRKLVIVTVPAIALAAVCAAVGTELWVRATWSATKGTPGFFLSDPVRGQRLAAGYDGWFAGVPVHINSLELRDPREYSLAKGPRTFRILVLGDSVTFGHGSVYEHTYPSLLEQQLKAWRPDVEWQVWNAAVPGYNTSQELAHLREVGPRFQPDLVIVGFFPNDLVDNAEVPAPGPLKRGAYGLLSAARRHLYSLELYKRIVLTIAWKLTAAKEYRLRVENLADEEALLSTTSDASKLPAQQLTPFDHLTDQQIRDARCDWGGESSPAGVDRVRRQPGFAEWERAVRGFQQLNASRTYRVVFFINAVPRVCWGSDVFFDDGSSYLNGMYLQVMGDRTPAVSCYDEFLYLRPSQMPNASAHSIGNPNLVKATVLFQYLRDRVMPSLTDSRLAALVGATPRSQ
jgi:hypothetical protein